MVITKAQNFYIKFADIQFLDIIKILGGATRLHSFLKDYSVSEINKFFPCE